ncbi:Cullin-4 [Diplonema papillatum]|nr:Cullin-4 [Diplonema papillatum]
MEARLVPELALLYKHMNLPNVQRTEALRNALKMYVKEKGTKRVSDESLDASLIQDLLTFKAWLDDIVTRAFGDKKDFIYVVRDAFENFLALRDVAPPSLLAKFIDGKMKVGNRESDKEVDAVLDQCLDIFRMISSKDVFEALYCKDFARRLLLGRCASMDTERVFISKLKVESGSGFTSKLEGMVKDLETSKEVTAEYESPEGVPPLSVLVLTELHWPQYQSCQVMLPKALSECLNHFKTFYTTKHRGRRLVWQSCLCTATVKATYAKGKKELIVSLLQALTLLVYNTEDQVTFGKIQELVGTRDQDLTRAVQGLIFAQARILKRKTKGTGRDLQASDVIEVNEDFQSKHFRVKINGMQMKDTDDTMQNTMKKVSEDRVAAIDACLVRTMKSKKTLTHPELMASCVAQLKFRTKPEDVKKRIEMLIEREYLRRDDNKQSIYHYIA